MDAYLVAILTTAAVYVILALALNIQFGLTGLMNFGVVGFYGVGAYTSGIMTETLGQPILLGMLAAIVVGGLAGGLVSLLSIRLSGDFLAIVTLGFAETMRLAFNNEDWLTRGPRGFLIMTRPVIDGLGRGATAWFILGVFVLAAIIVFVVLNRLAGSPFGRVLRAIREDDLVPATLGKNVLAYRLQAFVLGSAAMALAGSLYAHYVQTITPDNFTTQVAVLVWMSLIVGGAGNMKGAVVGALVVTAIYEGTRFLAPLMEFLTPTQVSALRFIIIGTLLIVVVRYRPEGLLPERIAPRSRPDPVPAAG
ncbi:branched-chain amino acid ABC transporter permease [Tropicimonas sediminicola]|uniref:Amino acid/amide ABC transporter membrane protein 2, HAAT family n=1 Tax=Tropicimonas sediminicola TaxID=1031541 RepID=A0A239MF35_9RHOB|nr:branched-chain amino acid ABC transporter permease [Tropicimonas sediminicola]SNT40724.1 amino acid/amide ABC transporter membrane protein 2, HAAT family [Tropicimonas sediminicola]